MLRDQEYQQSRGEMISIPLLCQLVVVFELSLGPDLWEHLEAVVDFLLDNRMARLALFMYLQERKRAIAW